MKKLVISVLFAVAAATPAFAAETFSLVQDTVGNCSAVVTAPNHWSGLKAVSDKTYASWTEADKALNDVKACKTFVR
jgi:hypothetical protein